MDNNNHFQKIYCQICDKEINLGQDVYMMNNNFFCTKLCRKEYHMKEKRLFHMKYQKKKGIENMCNRLTKLCRTI